MRSRAPRAYLHAGAAPHPAVPHCPAFELARCVDDASPYMLRIECDSAEGHLQGFRRSDEFRHFFPHVRPCMDDIAAMRHYDVVRGLAFRREATAPAPAGAA